MCVQRRPFPEDVQQGGVLEGGVEAGGGFDMSSYTGEDAEESGGGGGDGGF